MTLNHPKQTLPKNKVNVRNRAIVANKDSTWTLLDFCMPPLNW